MAICTRFCVLYFGLMLLPSCFLLYECRKINGYNFPVYATKHCPRNQAEWNERSSAINCTTENGYVCLPNENITELLEFCYIYPFILIQEGICLYLSKRYSVVDSYSCTGFQFGCPNTTFVSYNLFKNPQCTSIGNGCFRADPSCPNATSISYLPDATEKKRHENSKDRFLIGTISGVFIIACFAFVCFLSIKHRKGIRNCIRNQDVENQEENELLPLNITESCVEELDQLLIKLWQEDNKQFVETKASKEVERQIHSKDMVIVTGHTGSGKSAIVHHIALKYRRQGWNVKPICTVTDMVQIINSPTRDLNDRTLFVLNDPIGKDSFDEIEYTLWRKYEETLKAYLNKVKLLMSCRKYILNDDKVKGLLKIESNIVDISNDQLKLSRNEKEDIWNKYTLNENVSSEEFSKIVQTEAYFPLLCKLCFSKKIKEHRKLRFFTEPIEVLEDEIKAFRKSFKEKYCALVLLVLFNNDLCVKDLLESTITTEKYHLALTLCEMKKNTAPHTIDDALGTLQGFFVKKISDTYHFYHDFVREVTTFVFGKKYPLHIIEYADIGFLRKRVSLKCFNDNSDQFTIYLSDKYIDALGKRLFVDIFGERLLDVVLNPCLKNEKVIDVVLNELEKHPEKHRLLLEKKKLQIDTQEDSHASNHLFLSKLVFVSLEETISPLSAIIIFCDTRITLHCIKILQENPEYFIGNSLLSSVCCNGSKDVYSMFLKDHVKTSLAEKWKYLFPIHIASAFNNNDILRELLENGADVNQKTTNKNYWTPLTLAIGTQTEENKENEKITSTQSRRTETIELLLSKGAVIDSCKENGVSPLYIACQEGHDDTVQMLLNNKANTNLCKTNGESPLYVACHKGYKNIVKYLLVSGVDVDICMKNGASPLYIACQKGHEIIVQELLRKGANINIRAVDGASPLVVACQYRHENLSNVLLQNGAKPDLCMLNGSSPLIIACKYGHERIVQRLLSNEADINLCNRSGVAPLHVSCRYGYDNIVQLLLSNGADVNLIENFGVSPLHIACMHGYDNIVQILLSNGAKINLCDEGGRSPLYTACEHGYDGIVEILLNKGSDKNLCLITGESPLHIACKNNFKSIVQLLQSNGEDIHSST